MNPSILNFMHDYKLWGEKNLEKYFPVLKNPKHISQILYKFVIGFDMFFTQDTNAEKEVMGIKGSLTREQLMNFAE